MLNGRSGRPKFGHWRVDNSPVKQCNSRVTRDGLMLIKEKTEASGSRAKYCATGRLSCSYHFHRVRGAGMCCYASTVRRRHQERSVVPPERSVRISPERYTGGFHRATPIPDNVDLFLLLTNASNFELRSIFQAQCKPQSVITAKIRPAERLYELSSRESAVSRVSWHVALG